MGMSAIQWRKVTIADTASLSNALDITGLRVIALRQGASVEGTTFSFQGSFDGGITFEDIMAAAEEQGATPGAAVEYQVGKSATAAQMILLSTTYPLYGPTHLKVRTGLSAAATTQTGAADVWVGCEDVEAVNS